MTDEERKLYEDIDVTLGDFEQAIGAKVTISEDKAEVLMGRMRYPSASPASGLQPWQRVDSSAPSPGLSIHGVEGAFSGQGAKTVIPAAIKGKRRWLSLSTQPAEQDAFINAGKFSIRLVPDLDPDEVNELVQKYLKVRSLSASPRLIVLT